MLRSSCNKIPYLRQPYHAVSHRFPPTLRVSVFLAQYS